MVVQLRSTPPLPRLSEVLRRSAMLFMAGKVSARLELAGRRPRDMAVTQVPENRRESVSTAK
ncbi:MAG: hypothetical protein WKF58_09625 [Ilumatobacteraceae bacterium]